MICRPIRSPKSRRLLTPPEPDAVKSGWTAQRIGPLEVQDARNEMFKAKGGGEPTTYMLNVVEFGLAWKQDGIMPGGERRSRWTPRARSFLQIEAGVILTSDVDARITIKPIQSQDQNGQSITVSRRGNLYDPQQLRADQLDPRSQTQGRQGGQFAGTGKRGGLTPLLNRKSTATEPPAKASVIRGVECAPPLGFDRLPAQSAQEG